jgi:hypothetical protein
MNGWMDRRMNGRMDWWMDEYFYVHIYILVYLLTYGWTTDWWTDKRKDSHIILSIEDKFRLWNKAHKTTIVSKMAKINCPYNAKRTEGVKILATLNLIFKINFARKMFHVCRLSITWPRLYVLSQCLEGISRKVHIVFLLILNIDSFELPQNLKDIGSKNVN